MDKVIVCRKIKIFKWGFNIKIPTFFYSYKEKNGMLTFNRSFGKKYTINIIYSEKLKGN